MVKEKLSEWREKGLYLQFIPAYSPELNKIEILWSP
ncbi:transposase [Chondrinema litorale]